MPARNGRHCMGPSLLTGLMAEDAELLRCIESQFRPQYGTPFRVGFIVELDRVFAQPVLDAHAFAPQLQIADDFVRCWDRGSDPCG